MNGCGGGHLPSLYQWQEVTPSFLPACSQLELGEYKDIQLISSRRVSTDSLTTPCQPLLINQELSGPDQDQVVLVGREREQ